MDDVKPPFLKVGVTGGIGSGKSTVCRLFASLNRFVVMADEVARTLASEDPAVKNEIEAEFGSGMYPQGLLDRKALAAIVFADRKKRSTLDSIIHPRVFKALQEQLSSLPMEKALPYVLIEAALIYETGMDKSLDFVIVVEADAETCIKRVVARDKVTRADVERRIAAQIPMEQKTRRADFVIQNNGTKNELNSTVLFLDSILSHLSTAGTS